MTENSSSYAINALSKSKTRYQHQNQLLLGFLKMPGCTAKEVAKEHLRAVGLLSASVTTASIEAGLIVESRAGIESLRVGLVG